MKSRSFTFRLAAGAGLLAATTAVSLSAQTARPALVGRWDLNVGNPRNPAPAWLDVQLSGHETLVGYYVGHGGSVRPISKVHFQDNQVRFTVPLQWERGPQEISYQGTLSGDRLTGEMTDENGRKKPWTGVRAPALRSNGEAKWGKPIELWNGKDLTGWKPRHEGRPNGWVAQDGLLRNARPGNDLVTTDRWMDFKLRAEFRYPAGSNSGIYLRGRYEAQVEDNYGLWPESHQIGGIYGFLTPRVNAAKKAGEWQTYDLTLVGRRVTVVLNGEKVLDRQEIPGITGGALDSHEGEPGPIMLQGDHGPIDFRKLTLIPARGK